MKEKGVSIYLFIYEMFIYVWEAAKKVLFNSDPATKSFINPPPLGLVAIGTFCGPATNKRTFLRLS